MEISIDINDYLNEKSVTATIQGYIDQLHQAGGGRLMFASGVYPTGSLMLKVMLNSIYNRELFFDSRMIPKSIQWWFRVGKG